MQQREYLIVLCDMGRPHYVNSEELRDWKKGPGTMAYVRQAGEQGRELVTAQYTGGGNYQYYFMRPKQ